MNPTVAVLESRISKIDGGVAGLAVSSGQSASAFAVQNICHAGDNFISSTDLYGGTWNLFSNTFKDMGIECRFVDPKNLMISKKQLMKKQDVYMPKHFRIQNLKCFQSKR